MKHKLKKMVVFILAVLTAASMSAGVVAVNAAKGDKKMLDTAKVYGTDWKDEYIVANVNVKDAPFGAKGDGVTDDTEAIQSALNAVEAGGIVYIPAGDYCIKGNLSIPAQCTLIGDWDVPSKADKKETVLLAYRDRGTDFGMPFISMETASALKNISVYYPEQKADDIQPYPYTIGFGGVSVLVDSVTLYNSYNGINTHMSNGSAQHLFHVYGTPLNMGISFDINLEVSELAYVEFGIDIWAKSGREGAPTTDEAKLQIRKQTKTATGIACARIDDMFLYDIDIDATDYPLGVHFYQNNATEAAYQGGTYGHFIKLYDTNVYVEAISGFGVNLDIVDDIVDQRSMDYVMSTGRRTSSDSIRSVKESPYSAVGDGIADDTTAIKKCIDDVSKAGGGMVFFPAGQFKVTESIVVPSNVELRGVMTGPHTAFRKQCSQLNVYADANGKAAVILSESSGVNGLTFYYPENKLTELVELPYTIQGNGANVWVKAVTLVNSYDGIDLATNRCDGFFVGNTWGTAMRYGIYVGGNSHNGILENTFITYGVWQETMALHADPNLNTMTSLFKRNSVGYIFEDCDGVTGWSVFAFGNRIGTLFRDKDGKVADNATFYRLGLDTPQCESCLRIENAGAVEIYGLSSGSGNGGPGIIEAGNIEGVVNIYGQNIWGGCANELKKDGKVNVWSSAEGYFLGKENILAPVRSVTASSESFDFEYGKENVRDAYRYTMWRSEKEEHPSLTFELEKAQRVNAVMISHAATTTGKASSNARNYIIQVSNNNVDYKDVMKVTGNAATIALHDIGSVEGKYFRIVFDTIDQDQIEIGDVKLLCANIKNMGNNSGKDNSAGTKAIDGKGIILAVTVLCVLALGVFITVLEVLRRKKKK